LCCDGGTGAYEDKLMKKHHVGPFDLMFNIQFAKVRKLYLGYVGIQHATCTYEAVHTIPLLCIHSIYSCAVYVFSVATAQQQ
jgi:hypothetical protein